MPPLNIFDFRFPALIHYPLNEIFRLRLERELGLKASLVEALRWDWRRRGRS